MILSLTKHSVVFRHILAHWLLLVDCGHRCVVVVHVHLAHQIVVVIDGQAELVRSELLYVHHSSLAVVSFDLLPDPLEEQGDACE